MYVELQRHEGVRNVTRNVAISAKSASHFQVCAKFWRQSGTLGGAGEQHAMHLVLNFSAIHVADDHEDREDEQYKDERLDEVLHAWMNTKPIQER